MSLDLNVRQPPADVPLWSETRFNGCWSPESGVGVYIHAGRFRRDLDLWWCQVVAYLPDGALCVNRLWGRNAALAGVQLAGLDLATTEEGWTSRFDGVGQLTSTAELARGPRGCSAPSRALQWDLAARPAAPVWDMYAGGADGALAHADTHVQRGWHVNGTLSVDGQEYPIGGVGFNDHSSGPRDMSIWSGHRFVLIVHDEWTAHLGVMDDLDGVPQRPWGAFFRNGEQHAIAGFSLEPLADASGGPTENKLSFEVSNGERFDFVAELIHALPMTITDDNDNINGIEWEIEGDPLVLIEGKARLTSADGTVVYCFFERSRHRHAVSRRGA
jgi:hypothetical protein